MRDGLIALVVIAVGVGILAKAGADTTRVYPAPRYSDGGREISGSIEWLDGGTTPTLMEDRYCTISGYCNEESCCYSGEVILFADGGQSFAADGPGQCLSETIYCPGPSMLLPMPAVDVPVYLVYLSVPTDGGLRLAVADGGAKP